VWWASHIDRVSRGKTGLGYLTIGRLTEGENFGSQMCNFAALYAITRKTGHQIVFFEDGVPSAQADKYNKHHNKMAARVRGWVKKLKGEKKVSKPTAIGLKLHIPFVDLPIIVKSRSTLTENESSLEPFVLDQSVIVDSRIFSLDPNINYNIEGGFHSYRNWYYMREEIVDIFKFKEEIKNEATKFITDVRADGSELVSVHIRRGDYLKSSIHLNLSLSYYDSAFSLFSEDKYKFVVFSDDIEWCKTAFSCRKNIIYSENKSPYSDMCSMSLCDHNIIANSSFSFWGAMLNKNLNKRVVCPAKVLNSDDSIKYINYNWYPDNWFALDL